MMKRALITGISGQGGYYLTLLLLNKGYTVFGTVQGPASAVNFKNRLPKDVAAGIHLESVSLSDSCNIMRVVKEIEPHEIYNLAAQSYVSLSFNNPEYTADVNGLGPLRFLETIRVLGLETRFYQASSSEIFGDAKEAPQTEETPFRPCSPYATAKQFAFWTIDNYRKSYGLFACNGILYNHESPLRGVHFVTRKITRGLVRVKLGLQKKLSLGNLDAQRDWGHAEDYVRAQWLILQQDEPGDYIVATGQQRSVREFADTTAEALGMKLRWQGKGVEEKGVDEISGRTVIDINPEFFRPAEVNNIVGDSSKAHRKLGWKPTLSFAEMIRGMVENDLRIEEKNK